MPGRVLVIDDLATNRIILKVKLSSAYYEVTQATSVSEACAQLAVADVDLILLVLRDVNETELRQTITRLHAAEDTAPGSPVVVLLDTQSAQDRIAALDAGAEEVLSRPFDEHLFLARLRRLMRERLADQDLRHHALSTPTLGLAEAQAAFMSPGQIGLLAQDKQTTRKLQSRLAAHLSHSLRMMSAKDLIGAAPRTTNRVMPNAPDLFVMHFDGQDYEEGLRLFSAIKADAVSRTCPIMAVLTPEAASIAPQLLDLGAADVVFSDSDPAEIAARLNKQLTRKRDRDDLRSRLQDGLQAAVKDPLTGLYNRRYALSYLNCLMQERDSTINGFAVMVADLDYFKQVNDTYGHAAGDAVLVQVAELMGSNLREEDLVARIGGEEFLIVIPDTTQERARRIATELCTLVRDSAFQLPGHDQPGHVTISIGLTLATNETAGAEQIIDQADRALYRSKAEGRNTVRFNTLSAA